ncbi:hypothetical protein CLU79DRAFT_849078 [Phycomyces nitens]|nr:hypothetical protein CLU79DRAFT_849078 [Phycomyces nitens]
MLGSIKHNLFRHPVCAPSYFGVQIVRDLESSRLDVSPLRSSWILGSQGSKSKLSYLAAEISKKTAKVTILLHRRDQEPTIDSPKYNDKYSSHILWNHSISILVKSWNISFDGNLTEKGFELLLLVFRSSRERVLLPETKGNQYEPKISALGV